jgi:hypothetical protein
MVGGVASSWAAQRQQQRHTFNRDVPIASSPQVPAPTKNLQNAFVATQSSASSSRGPPNRYSKYEGPVDPKSSETGPPQGRSIKTENVFTTLPSYISESQTFTSRRNISESGAFASLHRLSSTSDSAQNRRQVEHASGSAVNSSDPDGHVTVVGNGVAGEGDGKGQLPGPRSKMKAEALRLKFRAASPHHWTEKEWKEMFERKCASANDDMLFREFVAALRGESAFTKLAQWTDKELAQIWRVVDSTSSGQLQISAFITFLFPAGGQGQSTTGGGLASEAGSDLEIAPVRSCRIHIAKQGGTKPTSQAAASGPEQQEAAVEEVMVMRFPGMTTSSAASRERQAAVLQNIEEDEEVDTSVTSSIWFLYSF